MVVWADDFDTIIPLAREFEEKLIRLVWKNRLTFSSPSSAQQSITTTSSDIVLNEKTDSNTPEPTARDKVPKRSKWDFSWKLSSKKPAVQKGGDPEKGSPEYIPRRMRYFAPFYNGLGCALSLCRLSPQPSLSYPLMIFQSSLVVVLTSYSKSSPWILYTTGSVC